MSEEQLSDELLIARVGRGDTTAFEILYDRHAPSILGLCFRITGDRPLSEEVLQEAFWRVWRNASAYRVERGPFKAWLLKIARNLAIDSYRRRRARQGSLREAAEADAQLEQAPDLEQNVPEQVLASLQAEQVQDALRSLPAEQRQVLELAYFYGLTRREIARATGQAPGTIHSRARLALEKLRQHLEKA